MLTEQCGLSVLLLYVHKICHATRRDHAQKQSACEEMNLYQHPPQISSINLKTKSGNKINSDRDILGAIKKN